MLDKLEWDINLLSKCDKELQVVFQQCDYIFTSNIKNFETSFLSQFENIRYLKNIN